MDVYVSSSKPEIVTEDQIKVDYGPRGSQEQKNTNLVIKLENPPTGPSTKVKLFWFIVGLAAGILGFAVLASIVTLTKGLVDAIIYFTLTVVLFGLFFTFLGSDKL